jgi:outer membrane cobalamin receptor
MQQMGFKDAGQTIPNYNNLTPSVVISKTFGKIHVVKWSYGKRIQRPLANLNPAINYIDSFNLQSGNPNLQPEIINRYEMSYTLNGRQLFVTASLFYNSNHNALEGVRLPIGNGIFLNTYKNIGHNDVLGLSFSFTWKWQQKFTINSTITFRENYMESKALQQSVQAFNINGNMTASYQFNKGYSLQAITYLGLDDYTLQGRRENWQFYGLTLNKKFKGDKVTVSFRADNFLSPAHQSLTQTWASPQFKQSVTTRYQNAYLFVALSWKLGKKEVKAPAVRQDSGD